MLGSGARDGRDGYWFPLALLGFLLLGGLAVDSVRAGQDIAWFAYSPAPGQQFLSPEQYGAGVAQRYVDYAAPALVFDLGRPRARDWPWTAITMVAFMATVGWYGWRRRRAVIPVVGLAVGGALAIAAGRVAAAWAAASTSMEPATTLGLPFALLGAVTGAWAYFRPGRRSAMAISAGCLLVGACILLGAAAPALLDPVIITAGLLALARYERSVLLALLSAATLTTMVAFPVGIFSTLIPATLLLTSSIAALLKRRPQAAGAS